jgi:hypothetical protein
VPDRPVIFLAANRPSRATPDAAVQQPVCILTTDTCYTLSEHFDVG